MGGRGKSGPQGVDTVGKGIDVRDKRNGRRQVIEWEKGAGEKKEGHDE